VYLNCGYENEKSVILYWEVALPVLYVPYLNLVIMKATFENYGTTCLACDIFNQHLFEQTNRFFLPSQMLSLLRHLRQTLITIKL